MCLFTGRVQGAPGWLLVSTVGIMCLTHFLQRQRLLLGKKPPGNFHWFFSCEKYLCHILNARIIAPKFCNPNTVGGSALCEPLKSRHLKGGDTRATRVQQCLLVASGPFSAGVLASCVFVHPAQLWKSFFILIRGDD